MTPVSNSQDSVCPITDSLSVIQVVGTFSGKAPANRTTETGIALCEKPGSVNPSAYLDLLTFKKFCKKLLSAAFQGCLSLSAVVRRSGQDRQAHKLVEVIISRLETELVSVRSFLPPGIIAWRWDPEVVALNNAINLINQAQLWEKPCVCVYCAGAPFYASKKPVASVGLVKVKAAGL